MERIPTWTLKWVRHKVMRAPFPYDEAWTLAYRPARDEYTNPSHVPQQSMGAFGYSSFRKYYVRTFCQRYIRRYVPRVYTDLEKREKPGSGIPFMSTNLELCVLRDETINLTAQARSNQSFSLNAFLNRPIACARRFYYWLIFRWSPCRKAWVLEFLGCVDIQYSRTA